MSYLGSEPAELLMLRARLCGINTDAQTIQELSARMRVSTDEEIQNSMIQIWAANVREYKHDYNRLLALIYLANDVIQLLKGSFNSLSYRYRFVKAIAEAILLIRISCADLIPKILRILNILKERSIFDTQTLHLLFGLTQSPDLQYAQVTILPSLLEHISAKNLRQLLSKQLNVSVPPTCITLHNSTPPPSIDVYLESVQQNLARFNFPKRAQLLVNLDAELILHIQNYKVSAQATILSAEYDWIHEYKLLLENYKVLIDDISSKIERRQKEESTSRYTIGIKNKQCATWEKVFLYKKEAALREKQNLFDRGIYWHLIRLLKIIVHRWDFLNELLITLEAELSRRSSIQ